MTRRLVVGERAGWLAVVAVLAIAASWLATLDVVLLLNLNAGLPSGLAAVARALGRVALTLCRTDPAHVWAVPAAAAALVLLLAPAVILIVTGSRPHPGRFEKARRV